MLCLYLLTPSFKMASFLCFWGVKLVTKNASAKTLFQNTWGIAAEQQDENIGRY
jgi:hypothetical protein